MPRTIVYIDGFNFYYGAIKGGPHKWLDLESLFRRLRPHDEIKRINYFTAVVNGPTKPDQETYLRALSTLPLVNIVLGKFKQKQIKCTVTLCTHGGMKLFGMPEEKRTDVNIAVQMLDDAYQDLCDNLILISGDSDLVPGVSRVKSRFPNKQIVVYVPSRDPTRGAAVELRASADKNRDFPLNLLQFCHLPANVPDGSGGTITKPASW